MWILESQTDLLDDFRDFRKAMSVVFVLMFVYIRARLMLIALALTHLLIFRQIKWAKWQFFCDLGFKKSMQAH